MNFAHVKLYFTYKLTNLITHNKTNKLMLETDYSEVREPMSFQMTVLFQTVLLTPSKGNLHWSGLG